MSPPVTAPPAAPIAERIDIALLANLVLIQIAVKNGKLHLYPERCMDALVFHVSDADRQADRHSPVKPWGVRWVATGLATGQKIVIEPKDTNDHRPLFQPSYVIEFPDNSIVSGHPTHGAGGKPREMLWEYSVRLMQGATELDFRDPGIVVKDDP